MPHRSCRVVLLLVSGLVAFAACVVVRLLVWVSSSPLAQDSSWSRTALRAAAHSLPHSVATRPSRHASVSVTARHGSRALSKEFYIVGSGPSSDLVTTQQSYLIRRAVSMTNIADHNVAENVRHIAAEVRMWLLVGQ